MANILHQANINRVLKAIPGAKRSGFKRAVKSILSDHWHEDIDERVRVIPDAYVIDEHEKTVIVYEVEDTSRIDNTKMGSYVDLSWILDEEFWGLCLVVVDRWGNANAVEPFMLDLHRLELEARS